MEIVHPGDNERLDDVLNRIRKQTDVQCSEANGKTVISFRALDHRLVVLLPPASEGVVMTTVTFYLSNRTLCP